MKLGFFDSGLGGLLIMKAVAKALPEYDYEYYGDTKNVPYGDKDEEEIYKLTKAGVIHLFEKDCSLVVIACNTASAETLRRLQDEFLPLEYPDRKILGVIIPVVEEVVESECKKVLMFATQRTVSSGKYHLELGKRNELNTKIEALATPEFVPLIEKGKSSGVFALMQALIDERIESTGIDGVILGCTHYTLLTKELKDTYGNSVYIFSQTEIIPKKLELYLQNHPEIETGLSRGATRNIFLTEHNAEYDAHLSTLLEGKFLAE
jgi:glutamate racemase